MASSPVQHIHVQSLVTGATRKLASTSTRPFSDGVLLSDAVYGYNPPTSLFARPAIIRVPRNGDPVTNSEIPAGSAVPLNVEVQGYIEGVVFFGDNDLAINSTKPYVVYRASLTGADGREVFTFSGNQSPQFAAMNATHYAALRTRVDGATIEREILAFDATTSPTKSPIIATFPVTDTCAFYDAIALSDTEVFVSQREGAGTNLYAIAF